MCHPPTILLHLKFFLINNDPDRALSLSFDKEFPLQIYFTLILTIISKSTVEQSKLSYVIFH
jgi:hypothetical protein